MNKIHRALFLAAVLALPLACKSDTSEADKSAANIPCTCGDASTDIEGCAHPSCLAGEANPDNPNCVCGSMSLPK